MIWHDMIFETDLRVVPLGWICLTPCLPRHRPWLHCSAETWCCAWLDVISVWSEKKDLNQVCIWWRKWNSTASLESSSTYSNCTPRDFLFLYIPVSTSVSVAVLSKEPERRRRPQGDQQASLTAPLWVENVRRHLPLSAPSQIWSAKGKLGKKERERWNKHSVP